MITWSAALFRRFCFSRACGRGAPNSKGCFVREKQKRRKSAALQKLLRRSFEQNARGVVAFDYNQFDRAYAHFIAAALLKPPVPKAVEIESKK